MDKKNTTEAQGQLEVVQEKPNVNASPTSPDGRKTGEALSVAGQTTAISKDGQSPMYQDGNILNTQQRIANEQAQSIFSSQGPTLQDNMNAMAAQHQQMSQQQQQQEDLMRKPLRNNLMARSHNVRQSNHHQFIDQRAQTHEVQARFNKRKQNRLHQQLSEPQHSFYNSAEEKRVQDGTQPKELLKAMSTYLNETGAGDYNLPILLGEPIAQSNKKTNPEWSFQGRNKLGWYKANNNHYLATQSPPPNRYHHKHDNPYFKNLNYSQSKNRRFQLPSSVTKLQAQLPVQYLTHEPGYKYHVNKKGIGYGNKFDFTRVRPERVTPGPKYNDHIKQSLSYMSETQKVNKNQPNSFFNTYDKWEQVCYHGMEQHFYLRGTVGPGHYMPQDMVLQSYNTKASQYSVPKNDRKLLTQAKERVPAGAHYNPKKFEVTKKQPAFSIGKQSRDVSFSKYTALHSQLVKKGLQ